STRVLIVGCGETAQMLLEKIHSFPGMGYYVVGFVAETGFGKKYLGKEIVGASKDILKIIEDFQVDEVIFARPNLSREKVLNLIVQLEKANVSVKMVSDLYDIVTSQTVIDGIADIPMMEIHKRRFTRIQDVFKLYMDYFGGTIFLLLSLPFWLILAIFIPLESAGPILVRSERVGKKGRHFFLLKFRTLYRDVPLDENAPSSWDDPRVTRIGRFLRRTNLDEWPQLINILRGEMSLVGPRPEMMSIADGYSDWQKLRLEVKPGITGLWQIMGRKDLFVHENLEYDFYYIKNRSILLDLTILLRTIPTMLFGVRPSYHGWRIQAEVERQEFDKLQTSIGTTDAVQSESPAKI
ncbi:MAG: sugar transferase, partial [bacterium]